MITPEYLEQCPDRLVEIYEQAERDIIADMARKISKYDYFSSAAEWQAMKLQEMGLTYKEIQKRLAKASGKTKAEIVKLLKEAGAKELKDDGVKPTQSTVNTLNAGLSKTLGTFDNLTRTTATQGTRQISQTLDRAYAQVSSGAFPQETAVKNAISDLAKNGIEAYDYGTRKDYIDVVVRRAVRTGVNQTVAKLALSNADELKTDLVEVSAHSGARPSHAEWQGKVYSISGETEGYEKLSEATGYGSVTGLCGANCRHTFYPFFEGDEPTYSEEELKSFDEPKYTYNGEKMTEYEATQRQRYIERQIRRWKREKVGMKAAGLSTEKAEAKIKHWNDIQEDFLKQTGLKRQYGREEAYNLKNIAKSEKNLEKTTQDDIMKSETSAEAQEIIKTLKSANVEYHEVKSVAKPLSEEEIIAKISGGDKTEGSCASLGLAYCGQKMGLDVLDFRDGQSRVFFGLLYHLNEISNLPGLKTKTKTARNSTTASNQLLKEVEKGKEYYFVGGRHAAIVRRTENDVLQYLELQSPSRSGWHDFDGNPRYTLNWRFGEVKGTDYTSFMIEVDSFKDCAGFREILGFLNTSEEEQRKGKNGNIK